MAQNVKHLFKITPTELSNALHTRYSDTAAPTLNPVNHVDWAASLKGQQINPQLIDVVNGFEWTHTPQAGRNEVPYVRMSEYQVEFSTLLQSIRYVLTTGLGGIDATVDALGDEFAFIKDAKKKTKTTLNWVIGKAGLESTAKAIKSLGTITTPDSLPSYLKPYYGLYGTQGTGFEYTFPYFETQWKEVTPKWAEFGGGGGLFSTFVNEVFHAEGIGKDILEMGKFLPGVKGTFIERAQEYTYGSDFPTWTFKFNLLNTRDYNDVVKNWQLCYLLSYQNLPNKTTKTLLDPPVIYEVEVPGVFYTPYAYITRLSIQNRGALRLTEIPVMLASPGDDEGSAEDGLNHPSRSQKGPLREQWLKQKDGTNAWKSLVSNPGAVPSKQMYNSIMNGIKYKGKGDGSYGAPGSGFKEGKVQEHTIETLVPDAYEVQITVQSLIPESKNLFFHSILGPAARASGIYNVSVANPDPALSMLGGKKSKQQIEAEKQQLPGFTTRPAGAMGAGKPGFG